MKNVKLRYKLSYNLKSMLKEFKKLDNYVYNF